MMARPDLPLLRKAFLSWDSVNNGWNQWVLSYDDEKQLEFLNKLSGKNLSLMDLVLWMTIAIITVMTITFLLLIKTSLWKLSPTQQLYAQYLNKLKRANLQPHRHEGALDFKPACRTNLAEDIMQIAQSYNLLQYSQTPNPLLLQALAQRVKKFTLKP